ncbi:uncharacterized protein LOC141910312 [Tubulanus polymorphus]|uniref:uncharacterized protein LOC141910312 n=1 Tax=Tubulanus polymorphus TaxID=672921 RepID=UPI003DA69E55
MQLIIDRLESQNSDLKKQVKDLQTSVDTYSQLLEEEQSVAKTISVKKDKKTYSDSFRRAAYLCLQSQVSVEQVGNVIDGVLKNLTPYSVDKKPDASTVSYFSYELGVLSDLQVAEVLVNEDNLTISWDATSLSGEHVNEVHINTCSVPPSSYIMQIGILSGGETGDYVQHIKDSLDDVIQTYAAYHSISASSVQSKVIGHLKNAFSDRVNVNGSTVRALEADLDIKLLYLNCNVHPLESVARKCRELLKEEFDQDIESYTFGSNCRAGNLLYGLSKMRYKQGKGDPGGFKLFLSQNGLSTGALPRYVGNRFHVIFHLAAVVFSLRDLLVTYLETRCNVSNPLKPALLKDMKNPLILTHLRVLGIIGKLLTGPWMKVFYANTANLTNLQTSGSMKTCIAKLKYYKDDPLMVLRTNTDVFGTILIGDGVAQDKTFMALRTPLSDSEEEQLFRSIVSSLMAGCIEVLERQLHDYINGDLANPSEELLKQTQSVPTHNMFAGRVMGLADHHFKRAPNATVGFLDGKIKSCQNQTIEWLDSKPVTEQKNIVAFSVNRARYMRKIIKQRSKSIMNERKKRSDNKVQKCDMSHRRKMERAIRSLYENGDPEQFFKDFDCNAEKKELISKILNDVNSLSDRLIENSWHDLESAEQSTYLGKIVWAKSKAKIPTVRIAYWTANETFQDAEDYKLTVPQIICDFMTGDLTFIN